VRPASPRLHRAPAAALLSLALASFASAQEVSPPAPPEQEPADREATDPERLARVVLERLVRPDPPEERRLATTLRSSRLRRDLAPEVFVEALAERGEAVVRPILELLVTRRVPGVREGQLEQILSVPQRDIVLAALGRLARGDVLGIAQRRLAGSPEIAPRVAWLEVLGAVGGADQVAEICGAALLREETVVPGATRAAFREALAGILGREARAYSELRDYLRGDRLELLPSAILAMGDAGDARGLPLLDEILTLHAHHGQLVASQVSLIGRSPSPEVNRRLAAGLRWVLDPARIESARAAVLALGVLRDHEALPALIGFLEVEHAGLRDNALWALRSMTGLPYAADARLWRLWHARELDWFTREHANLEARLASGNPAIVASALRAVGERLTRRDVLARDVLVVLGSPRPELRSLACSTLATLDEPLAVPALLDLLDDEDPDCIRAAREALVALTGESLPPDRDAWVAVLVADHPALRR